MLKAVILSATFLMSAWGFNLDYCFAECRYAECCYADSRGTRNGVTLQKKSFSSNDTTYRSRKQVIQIK